MAETIPNKRTANEALAELRSIVRSETPQTIDALRNQNTALTREKRKQVEVIKSLRAEVKGLKEYIADTRSELVRAREEAVTDSLTGIGNRRQLNEAVDEQARRFITEGKDFSVIMMDVNYLKVINDTLGHDAGDALIKTVAGVLRDNKRSSDVVCRIGGDEFAMILPETDIKGAVGFIRKFSDILNGTEVVDEKTSVQITNKVVVAFGASSVFMKDKNGDFIINDETRDRVRFVGEDRRNRGFVNSENIVSDIEQDIVQSVDYISATLKSAADVVMYENKRKLKESNPKPDALKLITDRYLG